MALSKKDLLIFLKAKSTKNIVAVLCVLALIVLAVPLGIRYTLQSYLIKHGAADAVISSLSLNPFTGTIKVKGVRVDGAEKRLFASSDFNVDIRLLSLFQKELVIETAYYDQLTIDLKQEDDGRWRIASYTTPSGEKVVEEEIVVQEVVAPSEWNIKAHQVLMTNCVVDLAMPDFSTQLVIEKAELSNFSTRADDQPALFTFVGSVDGSPLNISLETFDLVPHLVLIGEIDFQDYELSHVQRLLAPYLQKIEGSVSLKGATTIVLGETPKLSLDGDLTVVEMDLLREDVELSGKHTSLKGLTEIKLTENIEMSSSALFESKDMALRLGSMSYAHKLFSWVGDTGFTASDNGVSFAGKLNLKELTYSDESAVAGAKLGSFMVDAKGKYLARENHLAGGLNIDANVKLTALDLLLPGEMPMDIRMGQASLKNFAVNAEEIAVESVETEKTSFYSPLVKKDFIEFSQLLLTGLTTEKGWATAFESTLIKDITVFPRDDTSGHSVSLKNLAFENVQWSQENGVWLKKISAGGLDLQLVRDKEGSFRLGEQIASLSAADKKVKEQAPAVRQEKSDPQATPEDKRLRIDQFELDGENVVFYKDYTLEVPFESESEIVALIVKNLDSSKPEQESTLLMDMLLEKRAPFKVEGVLHPFADGAQTANFLNLKYSLKNYPIRNLSPYAVQNVGTALHSGELRLTGGFELSKGIVDSENELMLKRLTTKAMSAELAAKVDDKLPIPLDAALALLRDNEDNISLGLPIDGPVGELDFDVSDAIIIALGKAVVPAASSYLVYALGPYGALAYVGLKIGENVLEVRLPPVKFAPETIELTTESKDYLKRVGKILTDGKAQSDVQVCPVVSLSYELGDAAPLLEKELDIELKKELEELGQTRAKVVRDHLIRQYDVDEERLLLCITTLEKKGDSEVLLHADE